MINRKHDVTAQAVVEFARNELNILAEKYGGDCTLNEARVMIQIIRCQLEGRNCSVTALHKATVLTEIVYPPDRLFNVVGCCLQGAGTKGD